MTSVEGYGAIRFFDSIFYKTPHKGTWDNALTYNQNRVYATFSRRFSNWDYAWSRVQVVAVRLDRRGAERERASTMPVPRPTSPSSCSPFASGARGASSQTSPTRLWTSFDYSPLRERDAECLDPGRSRSARIRRSRSPAWRGRPSGADRGHRPRQPRDPRRALARRPRRGRGSPSSSGRCSRATTTPAMSGRRGGRSPPAR